MNTFLILLLFLTILHVVIDFYLQPKSWIQDKHDKKERSIKLYIHSSIHALVSSIPILFITTNWYTIICMLIIIGVSHYLIDLVKTYLGKKLRYFLLDQILHITVLVAVALHVSPLDLSISTMTDIIITKSNLAIALAYIVIYQPTSIVIGSVLSKYTPGVNEENEDLISGGVVIGYLERTLILTFTITGQFSVIGFILAAKSIFRFGELNNSKNHKLTEYVLLGSLLSVAITSIIGLAVKNFI
ncbi:hypothetical protein A9264_02780 [Vibrio sp. UCD-FRSSP16_10]|uniref:DUF3307 domain-containing protein n=1 Tax=unclassified Vibrio TaxID=2614977 RepID=UPI0007FB91A7|nr:MULTISPECIES: DUF3307 domain-containing protein [unclassified Vibrio]OBT12081.1 hypothetical protein A9260_04230 [Vibrio sp. UCD-FRSSP16_30]OBT20412.1 hypothetical protein A9264_02780 [Vibrio sp. UCD-FRSSP16_10]